MHKGKKKKNKTPPVNGVLNLFIYLKTFHQGYAQLKLKPDDLKP